MTVSASSKKHQKHDSKKLQMDWRVVSYALVNASPNSVFLLDETGHVLFSNQSAQNDLGLAPGSQLRQALPELWLKAQKAFKRPREQFRVTFQSNGYPYFAKLKPLNWKRSFLGLLCIIEDATELEDVLEGLEYYHYAFRELEAIISSSLDGIWVCDADATVLRINKASERLNNIRAEDVMGRNMHEIISSGMIDSSVTLEVLKKKRNCSLIQTTKDSRKLLVSGTLVYNKDGSVFRVVVNERDVSELYNLQQELEERKSLQQELQSHLNEYQWIETQNKNIIVKSENMANAFLQSKKVAGTDSTIVLGGETGSGKGLLAKFIHDNSNRCQEPFIKINCGSIPETLLESELFGYEKGAFTGADSKGKCGKFELANNGTLFLDEINELPPSAQVKLLHFLEDSCITRVGSTKSKQLNVRIIAASNMDLSQLVQEGTFRVDLFYRLNVIPIHIPPLRERKECILPLLRHYTRLFSKKMNLDYVPVFSPQAMNALLDYDYPGNVRELINFCERLVATCQGPKIDIQDLPLHLFSIKEKNSSLLYDWKGATTLKQEIEKLEIALLQKAKSMHSTQEEMASILGIKQSTVTRKLRKYGLNSK